MKRVMSLETINQQVVKFEYAVRGRIAIRAEELRNQLQNQKLPFGQITNCNIGNPQQLQQKPITFFRQVASLVEYPDLMREPLISKIKDIYPPDTIQRAQELLKAVGGSIGAYSHSQGVPLVRERIAKFISERDGYPSSPDDIFLTAGASPGVQAVLQCLIANKNVGIMIPIPQYPLYTASIAMFGGQSVFYYLDESKEWGLDLEQLKQSLQEAKQKKLDVRALCVINPGNPTGQCLHESAMREIVKFCEQEKLVLLADEVYQTNVYQQDLPFVSFKKVVRSMNSSVELISFHSVSKGMVGECGRRGGYFECVNIDPQVKEMLYKIASVSLCPPVNGQLMVENMVNPPKKGDPSYALYQQEFSSIFESIKRRATKLAKAFNELEGVSCNSAQGAMYLFPQIRLPEKAVQEARKQQMEPDEFYSMALLEATGVCVVAGSGFGQKQGTHHFRSTFLPPEDQMDGFISKIKVFHSEFLNKYR
ncbi:pyridoxal phosphate-dependent transferase [Gorgonomyces haynaldii]|nr:pyridoxal phosphate-dependent transferase [Gorgonomyces haynaldii]